MLSPKSLKKRQMMVIGGGSLGAVLLLASWVLLTDSVSQPDAAQPVKLATPAEVVDEREVWVNRIEQKTAAVQQQHAELRQENQVILKKLDVLEDVFKAKSALMSHEPVQTPSPVSPSTQNNKPQDHARKSPRAFAPPEDSDSRAEEGLSSDPGAPKILHLSISLPSKPTLHKATTYIPSGSYAKAVLTSGVVVSTSTNSQSNPQPILLRLVDKAALPRGFRGDVKDAVVIGACYGSLSSERANCRLHKLSLVHRNGDVLERPIQGWVIGDDGKPGLKGKVVDRSGEVARQALFSGILSGVAGFLQSQANSNVFPMSPFGQSDALKGGDLLKSSASKGVGSAFERLAEFSIKRAESMQPVLVISPGRVVDVVFKDGINLKNTATTPPLKRFGADQGRKLSHDHETNSTWTTERMTDEDF